jgi:hypothetical protein
LSAGSPRATRIRPAPVDHEDLATKPTVGGIGKADEEDEEREEPTPAPREAIESSSVAPRATSSK